MVWIMPGWPSIHCTGSKQPVEPIGRTQPFPSVRNPATHLVRALDVAVADERCDLVFVVDDIGNVTTWVTDASGAITRTFHMSQGENEIVPNDRYVSEYETVKTYFLEKVPPP